MTDHGAKWCSGPCGRLLPLWAFHSHPGGCGYQSECKACHRVRARDSARRRYAARSAADKARKRERYATDAAYRAAKLEAARVAHVRRKLAA